MPRIVDADCRESGMSCGGVSHPVLLGLKYVFIVLGIDTFLELQPTRKILVIHINRTNMNAMQSRNVTSFRQEQSHRRDSKLRPRGRLR